MGNEYRLTQHIFIYFVMRNTTESFQYSTLKNSDHGATEQQKLHIIPEFKLIQLYYMGGRRRTPVKEEL